MKGKLRQGDLWVSDPKGNYKFRVRIWDATARRWVDHATWNIFQLKEQHDARNLIQIEARPKLATYTGIYRVDKISEQ